MDTDRGRPTVRLDDPRGRWVLAVCVLGSAVASLEATVVNVALPTIGRDLDADVAGLQWTLNGYLLTLASLILLGGSLGDRYGRRRVFSIGVVWFTLASALCAFAPTIEALVAGRVLQGIGGALLTPGSLAIIEATFAREDRARAIGAWSALGGIAAAVGPLIGGWLVEAASWRWVFLVNLPLGVVVVLAAARHVPETRDPRPPQAFDVGGSLLASLGLGALTYGLITAGDAGVASVAAGLPIAASVAILGWFLLAERRARAPMVPLDIFRSRRFAAANVLTFVVYTGLGGVFFLLVVVLQTGLGYAPLQAGAASLPITVLMLLLSTRAGALAERVGPRLPLTAGPVLIAGGMLLMRRIGPGGSYAADILPALAVFGLGLSLVVAPVTATVLAAADDRYAGVASGINNAVARTAQLVAITALPLITGLEGESYRDPARLTDAFHDAMLVCAGLLLAGALLAWRTMGTRAAPAPGRASGDHCFQCGIGAPQLQAVPVEPPERTPPMSSAS